MKLATAHSEKRIQRIHIDAGLHMTSSDNVVHNGPIMSYYRTPIPMLSKDVMCGARQPKTKMTIEQSPEKPGVVVTWVFQTRR